jgi:hypothetical protein
MTDHTYFRWARRTTLLCLVLLCLSGLAQVLHSHSQDLVRGDGAEKTRCTLCVAGQSPQQATARADVQATEHREFATEARVDRHLATVVNEASRTRPPPSL